MIGQKVKFNLLDHTKTKVILEMSGIIVKGPFTQFHPVLKLDQELIRVKFDKNSEFGMYSNSTISILLSNKDLTIL